MKGPSMTPRVQKGPFTALANLPLGQEIKDPVGSHGRQAAVAESRGERYRLPAPVAVGGDIDRLVDQRAGLGTRLQPFEVAVDGGQFGAGVYRLGVGAAGWLATQRHRAGTSVRGVHEELDVCPGGLWRRTQASEGEREGDDRFDEGHKRTIGSLAGLRRHPLAEDRRHGRVVVWTSWASSAT